MATLLAIESSCDDTSAAVISNGVVLSNVVVTQEDHKQYGGVVPEVASRQHNNNIVLAVEKALEISKIKKSALDAIAVTQGPGLLGSLLVGVSFAKGLALALDKPLIAVHHMHAHILAHFIEDPKPKFPFICLTVSGGHSQLVIVHSPINMEVVGQTIDDAAGEAFDKAGKMFGLTYPAGPIIDKLAQHGEPIHPFAIAQIPDFNFSFSGFKTSVLYYIQKATTKQHDFVEKNLNDLCASVQYTIIKTLEQKLLKLIKKSKINEIAIAGGVAANKGLRNRLTELSKLHNFTLYIPKLEYCTDNAAMVAIAANYKYIERLFSDQDLTPDPRLPF